MSRLHRVGKWSQPAIERMSPLFTKLRCSVTGTKFVART